MTISRRRLLERLGAGAAIAVTAPRLAGAFHGAPNGRAASDTIRSGATIRLHRNENVLGPSPNVIAAMRSAAEQAPFRYPDVEAEALRRKIAAVHGVPLDRVVLGCGAGDILRMAIDAFVGAHKTIVAAAPTFEALGEYARRAGAGIVGIPLRKDHSHDVGAMLARTDAASGLVYICNPHNPTGSLTRRQDLDVFLRTLPQHAFVLVDEAYHHYVGQSADYASFIDRPADDPRVIVTRSFSTVHGLAGLRVGYAIAAAQTARALASHRVSDCVNVVAARAAAAALDDPEYVRMSVVRNADDRQEFLNQANARMLRSIDSLTNFVMLDTGRPSRVIVEHFGAHHILVSGPIEGFGTYIRVSLGTAGEMREFWRVWDLMPGGHMHGDARSGPGAAHS